MMCILQFRFTPEYDRRNITHTKLLLGSSFGSRCAILRDLPLQIFLAFHRKTQNEFGYGNEEMTSSLPPSLSDEKSARCLRRFT